MHINSARKICPDRLFISLFFSFNAIEGDKPNTIKEKSAGDNKGKKSEKKSSTNKEELANDNNKNLDNKLSTNIESLIKEKNINQDRNTSIQE